MTFFDAYQEMKKDFIVGRTSNRGYKVYAWLTGWLNLPKQIKLETDLPSWPDISTEDLDATDWEVVRKL